MDSVRSDRASKPCFVASVSRSSLMPSCPPRSCYDVAPDGGGSTRTSHATAFPPLVTHIEIILNWVEELKAKVPTREDSFARLSQKPPRLRVSPGTIGLRVPWRRPEGDGSGRAARPW